MSDTVTPSRGRFPGLTAASFVIARVSLVVLGVLASAWGLAVGYVVWQQGPLDRVANAIIAGKPFRSEVISALIPRVERLEGQVYCRPSALRTAAIIRLRAAEMAIADGERTEIDSRMLSLRKSILLSLSCSPADAFLWAVLYWLENTRLGFRPEHLAYLRMSYVTGPNEGWVAIKRNRLALANLDRLPDDLAQMALDEFASLLESGVYDDVITILVSLPEPARERALRRIAGVSLSNRQVLSDLFYQRGYDVTIPGATKPEFRPWH
ncbi:hypothetical protein [Bradyrhizobium guangdongense]|uniref:hypothetical protein n=1 Tax=Bradyrhizobium guangdongense TaxID=1325090 RepID=UPI00112E35F2|nr:hypothetical protein [Bradyrhizobium guangdongense]